MRCQMLILTFTLLNSAAVSQERFNADDYYLSQEKEMRSGYKTYWDGVALEDQRKLAQGKPAATPQERADADVGLRRLLYSIAVAKTLCTEQALSRAKTAEDGIRMAHECVKQKAAEYEKFSKVSDYESTISRTKEAQCEMRSRDYDNEIRFPPPEFLRTPDAPAPRLYNYAAFSDCLLSDGQ